MQVITTTEPTVEPVSLTDVKLHLRLAVDKTSAEAYTAEDDLLNVLIKSARKTVESIIAQSLITQTKTLYLDGWPASNEIKLPYPPLQEVTSVEYKPVNSNEYIVFENHYEVDTISRPGRVVLKYGERWPNTTLSPVNPVKITYKCGFSSTAESVPASIRAAMLLLISDLYENRSQIVIGESVSMINGMVDALLCQYRDWTFKV